MNRFEDNFQKYRKIQEWELANDSLSASEIARLSQLSHENLDDELHRMACERSK